MPRKYITGSLPVRLKARSKSNSSGCIEWTGTVNSHGYGQINVEGKNRIAHRVAWEVENGPIPDGMYVLHRCDNPRCIRVSHLFLGTQSDNMHDMLDKGRGRFPGSKGERNGNSRLTPEYAREIRESHTKGETQESIAARYNITQANVSSIVNRRTWKHI